MTAPAVVWADQNHWPLTPKGFLFLPEAFNRVGRHMFGAEWRDHWASDVPWHCSKFVEEASEDERRIAHFALCNVKGYEEDYRVRSYAPPTSSGQSLAALGQGFMPAKVGGSLAEFETNSVTSPSAADSEKVGYWFSDITWDTYKNYVHTYNEMRKPNFKKVDIVARWFFDTIHQGELTPYIRHRKGGKIEASDSGDWGMPTLTSLRDRIRSCSMDRGNASSIWGPYWVFFSEAGLNAALNQALRPVSEIETAEQLSAAQTTGEDVPHSSSSDDSHEPTKPRLTKSEQQVHDALVGEFGPDGGIRCPPRERAAGASAWAKRQKPRAALPGALPRTIHRLDRKTNWPQPID